MSKKHINAFDSDIAEAYSLADQCLDPHRRALWREVIDRLAIDIRFEEETALENAAREDRKKLAAIKRQIRAFNLMGS